MWSKPLLCRFRQPEENPLSPVPQGFAAFHPALSRIPPRHSQSRRATNFATPGYFVILSGWSYSPKCRALPVEPHPDIHFSAIISRRSRKSKIFLSAPVPMGKLVFAPLSVVSRNPANADAARLSGGSSYPVPDTAVVLSSAALSIGLPLILRIRRPHAGGVSTIPVFSPACKGKMSLRLTAPELPSAHPRGRSSPRPRPDPRAPCGRKPPACGKWACADPAPE